MMNESRITSIIGMLTCQNSYSYIIEQKKRNCASVSYKEAEPKPGIVVQHQCTQAVINHLGDLEEIEMTMKVPESSVRKAIQ